MSNKIEKGYVYILTNPSFKEDWIKIGQTQDIEKRLKQLYKTCIPLPFEIFATLKTSKYEDVEKQVKENIDELTKTRISKKREFFNISPEKALKVLQNFAATLDDAEIIYPYKSSKIRNYNKIEKRRPNFKFTMVGINIGENLVFIPTGQKVKVISENQVEYENKPYSLSGFTKKFIPKDKRVENNHYRGTRFFSYKGEILDKLRKERESIEEPKSNQNL